MKNKTQIFKPILDFVKDPVQDEQVISEFDHTFKDDAYLSFRKTLEKKAMSKESNTTHKSAAIEDHKHLLEDLLHQKVSLKSITKMEQEDSLKEMLIEIIENGEVLKNESHF